MLDILFKSVSETLIQFGENPKNGLGGQLGFSMILHTWDQKLNDHFHLHCLIPGGVMIKDGEEWKSSRNTYLFPEATLCKVFRWKFMDNFKTSYRKGELEFPDT